MPIVEKAQSCLDISLRKAINNYKELSPFTDEQTPSFIVNSSNNNLFKCFSSDIGGDRIQLVMAKIKMIFIEAVHFICNKQNISIIYEREEVAKKIQAE